MARDIGTAAVLSASPSCLLPVPAGRPHASRCPIGRQGRVGGNRRR